MDHLTELCREGRVAGVGMGTPLDRVRALLGEPYDQSAAREPRVLVYGALELSFIDGALEMTALGFGRPLEDLPPALAPGMPRMWGDLPRAGVLAALRDRGVALTPHPHPSGDVHDYHVATPRGDIVNVTFAGDRLSGVVCARGDRTAPRIMVLPAPLRRG